MKLQNVRYELFSVIKKGVLLSSSKVCYQVQQNAKAKVFREALQFLSMVHFKENITA